MYSHYSVTEPAIGWEATAEAERAYWQSRERHAVCAPVEIDVLKFHDAAGLMAPMNWRCEAGQDTETFMLREMYCGDVAFIYARCGMRYFRMRDYCNLNHDEIINRVKEVFSLENQKQK
ncbi:hypothetical protein B0570_004440 [Salmonella enterica subsp. enterica serovar Benue]|uniref:hypothetical protein n=1 Tax=Salmonella enterica TaxID=28901 RepID=UPI000FC0F072|nr:hypothetical protein [Salmonella enterica]EDR3562082.1 hypothetical protein [Salmonella enterica subsp. enterica serovar Benue]MIW33673.1 hypothetical protein [Salmonella enterica subsp. enterica serovar Derby]EHS0784551.1 hypothetical protein [Salmonella enterica]MBH0601278.1 hypothetical protein [Salmonella enterica]MBH0654974.1 hypothetical protein [Salmonella enterica]